MIRVLLADDHPLVREGVRAVLAADGACDVVGETGDGLSVVPLVARLAPDVVVLDLMLPGIGGLEVCRRLALEASATRVLILSMYNDPAYVQDALIAGASGYMLKASPSQELRRAVVLTAAGKRYVSPELVLMPSGGAAVDPYLSLTAREREVLHLAAQGMDNARIGKRLFISHRTVERHRANMLRKLDISPHEMASFAIRRGLITLDG